jgi:hypothetical protein
MANNMAETFKREMKYFVFKKDDVDKYLKREERLTLYDICQKIEISRINEGKWRNFYVVVNNDEPYADKVWKLIEDHWYKSKYNLPRCQNMVLDYLRGKDYFVSPSEIGNNAGGFTTGGRMRSSAWACRILKRLVIKDLVVRNGKGCYRLKA